MGGGGEDTSDQLKAFIEQRRTFPEPEGTLPAHCLGSQAATLPWIPSLPVYLEDCGLPSFHNHVNQTAKINQCLSLSLNGWMDG